MLHGANVWCEQTTVIPSSDDLDPDVLATMASLQCFKDKQKLIDDLLSLRCVLHNFHELECICCFLQWTVNQW